MLEHTPGVIAKTYAEEVNAYQDVANGRLSRRAPRLPDLEILRLGKSESAIQRAALWPDPLRHRRRQGQHPAPAGDQRRAREGRRQRRDARHPLALGPVDADRRGAFGQPEEPSVCPTRNTRLSSPSTPRAPRSGRDSSATRATGRCSSRARSSRSRSPSSAWPSRSAWGSPPPSGASFGPPPVRWLATLYIEIVRGNAAPHPAPHHLLRPAKHRHQTLAFLAGVLGLGLNYAAYEAENYRAGCSPSRAGKWRPPARWA